MPNTPISGVSTLSQSVTPTREFVLASPTANATIVNGSATSRVPTATSPATNAASGIIAFPSEGTNYLKICPVVERSTAPNTYSAASVRVVGWNYDAPNSLWVPITLADFSLTLGSSFFSLSSIGATPTFRQTTGFTLNAGDAKIYNSPTVESGAFACVDTWGCSVIELEFRGTVTAGSPKANCWYASA
jgi:hypothetical protein